MTNYFCDTCQHRFQAEGYRPICPVCGEDETRKTLEERIEIKSYKK